MLNIVVPMAGRGQRFADVGYELPKPLIPIHGVPMIRVVIANLTPTCPHRFVFPLLREHVERYKVHEQLCQWAPGCEIIIVDQVTEGAACTVLLARHLIDTGDALMIANCDQYIDKKIDNYIEALSGHDGLIMTMWADDPKWSFVRRDNNERVVEVVEKKVVSNEATVGIYNFSRGADFVKAADAMIAADLRVNNEFYVAPVYDQMIAEGAVITCYSIGRVGAGMYGIGTPKDFDEFCANPVSMNAVQGLDSDTS